MQRKATLNGIQKIELYTEENDEGIAFILNAALDSFHSGGASPYNYSSHQEAFDDGIEFLKYIVQEHLDNTKQQFSELDQELVIKFLENES